MKLIAQENFSWAHRGVEVEHFEKGVDIDTDDEDLIEVAVREGWAAPADGEAPPTARAGRKPKAT